MIGYVIVPEQNSKKIPKAYVPRRIKQVWIGETFKVCYWLAALSTGFIYLHSDTTDS